MVEKLLQKEMGNAVKFLLKFRGCRLALDDRLSELQIKDGSQLDLVISESIHGMRIIVHAPKAQNITLDSIVFTQDIFTKLRQKLGYPLCSAQGLVGYQLLLYGTRVYPNHDLSDLEVENGDQFDLTKDLKVMSN